MCPETLLGFYLKMPSKILDFANRYKSQLLPFGFIVLNAAIWTLFAASGGNANLHGDSLEAYVWGREFQLGYYKHPPFWSWIAGLWFFVFPHKDWAFYLLSELNASLGIVGAWALLGRFVKGPARYAGVLLLLLTTFYTFNALRYNANTILLSLWPWTMYFYVLSLERKDIKSGVWFGLVAAAAVLSKYYSALLLVSCFAALWVHPEKKKYIKSPAPWVAAVVFFVALMPHCVWLIRSGFLPFVYAYAQEEAPKPKFVGTNQGFLAACLLFHSLQLAVLAAVRFGWKDKVPETSYKGIDKYLPFLSLMGVLPFLLTFFVGLGGYRIMPNYVIPIFSLTPFLMMIYLRVNPERIVRICRACYGAIVVACLIAAPFLQTVPSVEPLQPREELYKVAIDEWNKVTKAPLRIVGGTQPYTEAVAFYDPQGVSEFSELNYAHAPWITKDRIEREGLLILCRSDYPECNEKASSFATPQSTSVRVLITPQRHGYIGREMPFTIVIIPPVSPS